MAVLKDMTAASVSEGRRWGTRQEFSQLAALPQPYLAVRGTLTHAVTVDNGQVFGTFGSRSHNVILPADAATPYCGVERIYVGRLRYELRMIPPAFGVTLDTTASRFHPASVAGLVVGAMGCFIFGLFLRRWLKERTASI
jgi:hypothetical protein